jgi:hypothetical protein
VAETVESFHKVEKKASANKKRSSAKKKRAPAKKKRAPAKKKATKKKVEKPVVVKEVVEVVEPDLSVVPLAFEDDKCDCGDTCDKCFIVDEPQPPVSEEVKPKRQGRRSAVPFVRISGRPINIRM